MTLGGYKKSFANRLGLTVFWLMWNWLWLRDPHTTMNRVRAYRQRLMACALVIAAPYVSKSSKLVK